MTSTNSDCNGNCPGPMGPQGPMGPAGMQGPLGPQGQAGQSGAQGVPGPAGPAGANGQDGIGLPGANGAVGPVGPQGPAGQQGLQGQPGQNGSMGPPGPQGNQGQQGPQGVPGDCVECPCNCDANEFAEVYSQVAQQLVASPGTNMPGGTVLFENTIVATAGFDASLAASAGQLKVFKAGWYDVAAGMTGTLNPIPAPLPVWTLSLFLNGAIVPGSTFSNVPLSPAQASNEITADTFVYCNAGDVLSLANTSGAPVFLSAPTLGTNSQTNSAYLKCTVLRLGAK